MNTLILQHFEPYWSEGLSKLNTSFEQEMAKVNLIKKLSTEEKTVNKMKPF